MKQGRFNHLKGQRFTALVFALLILASLVGADRSVVAQAVNAGERIPVVLFGIDAADESRHTDTLMVGVIDPIDNYASILSVPRDTRIDLPGYRFRRVNEVYGYQLRKTDDSSAAARMVLDALQHLLGGPGTLVRLPYYLQVDFNGFRRVIDLLGGVWVTVKLPMDYDDYAGHYHFHKQPGRYLMQGDEALLYVRFRGQTGDRGRIYRQQEFVRSMIKRFANPMMVLRIPGIAAAVASGIRTNLSAWDLVYLAVAARRIRSTDLGFYILPGSPSGPYWRSNKVEGTQLASLLMSGIAPKEMLAPTIAPQADRVTIKVWNASGRAGLGYKVTKVLRRSGYDVVDWANFAANQLQTRVIDRTGKIANAEAVAAVLGVENYHSEPDPKKMVDVEVVVGQNFVGVDRAP